MILRASLLIVLLTAVTTTAHAQQLTHDFQSFPATPNAAPRLAPPTPPPTYWLEGGLIGGDGLRVVFAHESGGLWGGRGGCFAGRGAGGGLRGAPGFTVGAPVRGPVPKAPWKRGRRRKAA